MSGRLYYSYIPGNHNSIHENQYNGLLSQAYSACSSDTKVVPNFSTSEKIRQQNSIISNQLSASVSQFQEMRNGQKIALQCSSCFVILNSSEEIYSHLCNAISTDAKQNEIVFNKCNQDFYTNEGSHIAKKNHIDDSLTCGKCKETFTKLKKLQSHLVACFGVERSEKPQTKRAKIDNSKSFHCGQCGRVFTSMYCLRNHIKLHNGDRPFVCTKCDKGFVLLSCLKTHMKQIHTDRKYQCSVPGCNKVFRSENYAKIHLKIHNNIFDFECDLCDKRFVDRQSLKIHIRSHTKEKPFECNDCHKRFAQGSHLKTHQRLHTDEKPFVCNVCGKAFRQTGNLIEHKAIYHKD